MTLDKIRQSVPITSEMLEPFAVLYIGRMFARCEEARISGDERLFLSSCRFMWWGLCGLQHVATAVGTAIHYTICLSNDQQRIAAYITDNTGINPYTEKDWNPSR